MRPSRFVPFALILCIAAMPLVGYAAEHPRDAVSALASDTPMDSTPDVTRLAVTGNATPSPELASVVDLAEARAERSAADPSIGGTLADAVRTAEIAAKVPLERVVLDAELLEHAKTGHAPCEGRGFIRRMPIASGIRLVKSADGKPGHLDAKREPKFGEVKLPEVEHRICLCAANAFARLNRGRAVQVAQRFYWLKGHAPALPAVTRSPFAASV
jgi:hypothetical protein